VLLLNKVLQQSGLVHPQAELQELADLVGHLPLAVDIAASRLACEPGWRAGEFVSRLRYDRWRLKELSYGDQSIYCTFDVSYEMLLPSMQQFFAALSTFGGDDFSTEAAAYVTEVSHQEAEDNLRFLFCLCLIQESHYQRWRLHPIVRDYARERVSNTIAWARMVTFFTRYALVHENDFSLLEKESKNILYALQIANERQLFTELIQGINAIFPFMKASGLYQPARDYLERALSAARSLGEARTQMALLSRLEQLPSIPALPSVTFTNTI
jgi:hypothetical protein